MSRFLLIKTNRLVYGPTIESKKRKIASILIGSYEAKIKLPTLIREVQPGRKCKITMRGKAIAEVNAIIRAEKEYAVFKAGKT